LEKIEILKKKIEILKKLEMLKKIETWKKNRNLWYLEKIFFHKQNWLHWPVSLYVSGIQVAKIGRSKLAILIRATWPNNAVL